MEFQSSFLVIIALLFSLLCLAKIYKQKIKVRSTAVHKLPPGPWKLPLIGNLHQLATAGSLPHHTFRDLANKYGPLMHLQLGESSTVVVSSPDMAKEIMKTHDLAFASRPELLSPKILAYGSTDIAFAPYGDYWKQMRKICTSELLSPKRVQSFSFIREDEVANLIQSIHLLASTGSLFNLSKSASSLINTIISRAAFGKKSECEDELLSLIKKAAELTAGFDLAELFPSLKPLHLITRMKTKLENMHKKFDKVLDNIVNEHQLDHGNGENLVNVLLRMQQSDNLDIPITVNNIKAVIWDIIIAGTDTSATTIEWVMAELMKNPRVREKAQAELREAFRGKKTINETDLCELSYLNFVIKETLRLHPPAPLLVPRECRETCKIGGYEIPIKTKVIVNAWALGRDPQHWYDAEKFIPARFHETSVDFKGNNFEYIPFGAGRRICPGILLGLANIELALAALLYHFDWKLPNSMKLEDLDMIETYGAAAGRKNNLYLIPTPYNYALHRDFNAN
ncbi:cytochrome P450 71D8-like [Lotus japonicus]|uniref:cytochrome P450 71D8-like n=1 Tax=Lotus japonicus TaxID=34305 RepID=UPI002582D14D|nr:cytochrome P450 71D8-like [Lotus japonicus]